MSTNDPFAATQSPYPARVYVEPALEERNRLTTAFRFILAIPHMILVGGPVAGMLSWTSQRGSEHSAQSSIGGGVIGVAVSVVTVISWFAILFTGRQPQGLRDFAAFYLRWRVRATAYLALFRDEYPPFGEGPYPAVLDLEDAKTPRDRLTVAFRLILAIPHFIVLWFLGFAWCVTTIIAWFAILFTGRYPEGLYRFGVGVLRWSTRVETYMLLLFDEYPPFSLD